MHWTLADYRATPKWFINDLCKAMSVEAEAAEMNSWAAAPARQATKKGR